LQLHLSANIHDLFVNAENNPSAKHQSPKPHRAALPVSTNSPVPQHTPECLARRRASRTLRPCLDCVEWLRCVDGNCTRYCAHSKGGYGVLLNIILLAQLSQHVIRAYTHGRCRGLLHRRGREAFVQAPNTFFCDEEAQRLNHAAVEAAGAFCIVDPTHIVTNIDMENSLQKKRTMQFLYALSA